MSFKSFHEHAEENKRNSILFIFVFFLVILLLGYFIGELAFGDWGLGLIFALFFFVIYFLIVFFSGDKIVMSLSNAKKIEKADNPRLWNTVEGLSIAAGMPMPDVYIIDSPAMNAFASGRNPKNSAVAFTQGLLDALNKQELEGVAAHELAHVKNRDVQFMMFVALFIGLIGLLSNFLLRMLFFGGFRRSGNRNSGSIYIVLAILALVFAILSPFLAQLIRFSISRKREFLADADGARLTRYPPGLASALQKISKSDVKFKNAFKELEPLYIHNPFSSLFSTHPPIEERVKRLKSM